MAQPSLSQDDIKVLEFLRQRLLQLTSNIASTKTDINNQIPLPSWTSLQTHAGILANNVDRINSYMDEHSELLNRTVVYPQTNYPGRTQEGLLVQLLRKKLEPQVETWVDEGRAIQADPKTTVGESEAAILKSIKDWILHRATEYGHEAVQYQNYTAEEFEIGIDSIRTGLRRKLEEDESEQGEDEEMDNSGVQVTSVRRGSMGEVEYGMGEVKQAPKIRGRSIEEILRFATAGVVD